nr:CPPV155 hypothetical protein [Cooks petrelpox virus]
MKKNKNLIDKQVFIDKLYISINILLYYGDI